MNKSEREDWKKKQDFENEGIDIKEWHGLNVEHQNIEHKNSIKGCKC
jgi:hypothetical protein